MTRTYAVAAVLGLAGVAMLAIAGFAKLIDGAVIDHRQGDSTTGPLEIERAGGGADRGGEAWGESYFPNIELTTHEGETVRFFDDVIEGKVVAINFIYTWCPDTCPVETARMLQVANLLGDRLGRDVFFYSITIDPEYDTQPVLAAFAESWRIPDGWKFLTGDEADIVRLRKKLGMRLDDVRTGDISQHSVSLLIGNQETGRWMKRSPFENPYVLANQLGSWLHGWKRASETERSYEDAPELRQISDGEYIFRNRCGACHTVGRGDLREADSRNIGPDLFDVTRVRDREWLERWITEPDAMLEEGDPLATALYEEWNRIPMPNMRLTEKDVTSLLGYIEQESARIRAVRSGRLADHTGHDDHEGHGAMPGMEGMEAAEAPEHGAHADHEGHGGM